MSTPSTIAAASLVSGDHQRADAVVELANGCVVGVRDQKPGEAYDVVLPDGVLVPGLVDMQINGCFGVDFAAATPSDWGMVVARMPETGVTAFAPTFITAPVADLAASLRKLAEVHAARLPGSRVLGAYVEGPFLGDSARCTQPGVPL